LLGHGTSGTLASTEGGATDDAAGGTPVERVRDREALLEELVGNGVLPENMRGRLLRTREVALLFQVSERAVTDWARRGRIPSVRTPGGHRRYPADEVWALLRRSEAGE
jgi:excisionase family DNA binding protein